MGSWQQLIIKGGFQIPPELPDPPLSSWECAIPPQLCLLRLQVMLLSRGGLQVQSPQDGQGVPSLKRHELHQKGIRVSRGAGLIITHLHMLSHWDVHHLVLLAYLPPTRLPLPLQC